MTKGSIICDTIHNFNELKSVANNAKIQISLKFLLIYTDFLKYKYLLKYSVLYDVEVILHFIIVNFSLYNNPDIYSWFLIPINLMSW